MWNDNGDGNDGNGGNGGNDVNGGNDGNCTYPTFCLLRGVMMDKRGDDILAARSSLTHCHLLTDQLLFKTLFQSFLSSIIVINCNHHNQPN